MFHKVADKLPYYSGAEEEMIIPQQLKSWDMDVSITKPSGITYDVHGYQKAGKKYIIRSFFKVMLSVIYRRRQSIHLLNREIVEKVVKDCCGVSKFF